MTTPKISVIVPIYNTERFLEKCLISIQEQTFRDIEILCVNDCTPDESVAIVNRFAKDDSRIRLIEHTVNLGLGGARNTGLKAARADYIASVDSDDYIMPTMLEDLYNATENGHFDVVCCGYERVDEHGNSLSRHLQRVEALDPISENANPYKISNPAFWNKLWRKALYLENEIFFPEHIYYQDAATTPRIYSYAKNINFIGGRYYKYLVRSDSVTNKMGDKHLLDKFRELDYVKDFFIERNMYEKYKSFFEDRVFDTFKNHWLVISENNPVPDAKVQQYLRHLLLLRSSYLQFDDYARAMSIEDVNKAFESHNQVAIALQPTNAKSGLMKARWTTETPKVLILTLHAGENEFEQSKAAVLSQTYKNWEHKIISGLGNVEAHEALYNEVMARGDEFDLFLKLDADMVMASPDVLQWIVDQFRTNTKLDHLIVGCDDWMTGTKIIGVHTFSNRVRWEKRNDQLFLDPSPIRPGERVILKEPRSVQFLHSPDPSEFQAFHFGAHRALKITQKGRSVSGKKVDAIMNQWDVFYNVWLQFDSKRDKRHGLALLAAHQVFTNIVGQNVHNYDDKELRISFDSIISLDEYYLYNSLKAHWEKREVRQQYFKDIVGVDGLEAIDLERSRKRLAQRKGGLNQINVRIRTTYRYRLYKAVLDPFLNVKLRKKLESNPVKFFRDAKHPVFRAGRWIHKKYLNKMA